MNIHLINSREKICFTNGSLTQHQLNELFMDLQSKQLSLHLQEELLLQRQQELNAMENGLKLAYQDKLDQLEHRQRELDDLLRKINTTTSHDAFVILNVGGTLFETTIFTLTSEKDTFFSALFSDHFRQAAMNESGEVFIDRSPKHFSLILEHLRGNCIEGKLAKLSNLERNELLLEVDYYQIGSLFQYFSEAFFRTSELCTARNFKQHLKANISTKYESSFHATFIDPYSQKVYQASTENRLQILEFDSVHDLVNHKVDRCIELDRMFDSTYMCCLDEFLFYSSGAQLIKVDTTDGNIVNIQDVPQASICGRLQWSGSGAIQLLCDSSSFRLFATYTGINGLMVLSEIDTITLQVLKSWDMNVKSSAIGYMFMYADKLFIGSDFRKAHLDACFNLSTSELIHDFHIELQQVHYCTHLSYDAKNDLLIQSDACLGTLLYESATNTTPCNSL